MVEALRQASDAVKNGEVVCIFAEGQITRIGQMLPFRRGLERIMKDVEAPIVPVCLDGVWGSVFSFENRRFLWKVPHRIPYPVTVVYGPPMPAQSTAIEVRQVVQQLQSQAWRLRKVLPNRHRMPTLHRAFVRAARRAPFRFAMADAAGNLSFGAGLVRTVLLARRLKASWARQEMIGVLLPPSVAGALVNFAALLMGKVPVNLNYSVSEETIASCVRQCGIQTVISSKIFLEKLKLKLPCKTILLEELPQEPRRGERLMAALISWALPVGWLERTLGRERKAELDDIATVIFSSGSTGDPKGVMLSHYNIASNIEQLGQVFSLGHSDRFLGILPFFHSLALLERWRCRRCSVSAWFIIRIRSTQRALASWSRNMASPS